MLARDRLTRPNRDSQKPEETLRSSSPFVELIRSQDDSSQPTRLATLINIREPLVLPPRPAGRSFRRPDRETVEREKSNVREGGEEYIAVRHVRTVPDDTIFIGSGVLPSAPRFMLRGRPCRCSDVHDDSARPAIGREPSVVRRPKHRRKLDRGTWFHGVSWGDMAVVL